MNLNCLSSLQLRLGPYLALMLLVIALIGCAVQTPPVDLHREQSALVLVDRATQALRAGALDEAQAGFSAAWETSPSTAALDGLGCVAFQRGDFLRAEEYFLRAMRREPEYGPAYANLALLYEIEGRLEQARELYDRSVELDPLNPLVRNNRGALLSDLAVAPSEQAAARQEILKAAYLSRDRLVRQNVRKITEE